MRRRLAIALIPALIALSAGAARADGPNCIDTTRIRETRPRNDNSILFVMNDGTIWQNHLRNYCPNLKIYGFAYEATPPHDLCGNVQSIRVLRTGAVCMLGSFTRWPSPEHREPQGGQP